MMKIFNSMTKLVEEVKPIVPGEVGMYACGPTVYDYPHIGHGRKYVNDDVLKRALKEIGGLKVTHVQNITDVGHLVSDGDEGEDKLEKGARKYGKTVWEVASEYTDYFLEEMDKLNIIRPDIQCKATDHIEEQINLIKKIIENGFGYDTNEAVYFDVSKMEDYGALFGQAIEEKQIGAREEVELNTSKKHPADFALWFKRVGKFADHVMHWNSPWGDGFPGWHIECSAMSMRYLGDQFEIHTGGEDHLSIHHPNEIAQSEAATSKKPFVKYWFHSAFLMVDGKKMSKSLGNVYKVADVVEKGFSPMALRYYYLSTHYRKQMNFTWEGMEAAQNAYSRLSESVKKIGVGPATIGEDRESKAFLERFTQAVEEDLNISMALSVIWETLKSGISEDSKRGLISLFDKVLGLNLERSDSVVVFDVPDEVMSLVVDRNTAKTEMNWHRADAIRDQVLGLGFKIVDTPEGTKVEKVS